MSSLLEILATAGAKAFFTALAAYWRERSTYRKLKTACKQWSAELPDDLQFQVVEMFLGSAGQVIGVGRHRTVVRSLLRDKRIPPSEIWSLALLERWVDLKAGLRFEAAESGIPLALPPEC